MTAPTITPLPEAPSRTDGRATFIEKADAFVGGLPTFGTEANVLGAFVENQANNAEQNADAAAASAAEALTAADVAMGASSFKGDWSSLTGPLNIPSSVMHSNRFWLLLNNIADVSLSEPGVAADWRALGSSGSSTLKIISKRLFR